jgi:hypothetical protein
MTKAIRIFGLTLTGIAAILWFAGAAIPPQRSQSTAPLLDWVEQSGEVSYTDAGGCYCTNTSAGKCSVQYDKKFRSIGSCDDTDTACGDITGCPH